MKGMLIGLDGTDGSGKKTQTERLVKRLKIANFSAETMSFPQYGKKSAGLVEEYLNGNYGSPDKVGPYRASIFYACDRYDASFQIREWLKNGKIIVLDRYVAANAGHQGGKISDPREREQYLQWLYELEFFIFEIPKPDVNIILDLPPKIAQERKLKGEKRAFLENAVADIHERDLNHLRNAEVSYLWLAEKYPDQFKIVACMDGDRELNEDEVEQKVWETILPFIQRRTEIA